MPDIVFTFEDGNILALIRKSGIKVEGGKLVAKVQGGMVTLMGGTQLGPFDSVVMATGTLRRAASWPPPKTRRRWRGRSS